MSFTLRGETHDDARQNGMDEETLVQIRRRVRARGLEALVAALG